MLMKPPPGATLYNNTTLNVDMVIDVLPEDVEAHKAAGWAPADSTPEETPEEEEAEEIES